MANFANIANTLEGIINNQLNLARSNQGVWEWYNGLQRIMSPTRWTGTPRVSGPTLTTGATEIVVDADAVRVFGVLIDNSMAAEDAYVGLGDVDGAFVPGTDNVLGPYLWALRATMQTYLFPEPLEFDLGVIIFDSLGTQAGLEAGTASTTGSTTVVVYTD